MLRIIEISKTCGYCPNFELLNHKDYGYCKINISLGDFHRNRKACKKYEEEKE